MQGEPCVNQWLGVYCCPDDRPHLVKKSGMAREEDGPRRYACRKSPTVPTATPSAVGSEAAVSSGNVALDEDLDLDEWHAYAGEVWPAGCRGSAVGAEARAARCVVVMLELRSNRLAGTLPDGLGQIPTLRVLDIRDNQELTGTLPDFLIEREWLLLGIGGSSFQYAKDGSDESDLNDADIHESVVMLMQHCNQAGVRCEGLPPRSCSAFGSERCDGCFFVVETLDPTKCLSCEPSPLKPILTMSGMVLAGLVFLAGYAWLVQRHPEMIQGGWGTFAIFLQHTQTVSIMGQLRLQWPPTILAVLEGLGFSIFSIEIGRPECLLGEVDEGLGGPFYMISMIKFILLLFTFAALWAWARLLATRGRCCPRDSHQQRTQQRKRQKRSEQAVDQLEMVESIIFSCQIILAWKLIFRFLVTPEDGGPVIWQISSMLVIVLIMTEVLLMGKYYFYLHVLQVKEDARQAHQAHALGASEAELTVAVVAGAGAGVDAASECNESLRKRGSLPEMAPSPPTTPEHAAPSPAPMAPPGRPEVACTSSPPLSGRNSPLPSPPESPLSPEFTTACPTRAPPAVSHREPCQATALDEPRFDEGSEADDLDETEVTEHDSSDDCTEDLDDAEEEAILALALDPNFERFRFGCWGCGPLRRLYHRTLSSTFMRTRRLKKRMSYLCRRYGEHAQKWQFVNWGVQLALLLISLAGETRVNAVIDAANAATATANSTSTANETNDGCVLTSAANMTSNGCLSKADAAVLASIGRFQAASACALLTAFLVLHMRVSPYVYRFQNRMEAIFLGTDISAMAIGVFVTFLGSWPVLLEWAVVAIISATAGGGALFLTMRLVLYIRLYLKRKLSVATSLRKSVYDIARDIGVPGFSPAEDAVWASGRASHSAHASRRSARRSSRGVSRRANRSSSRLHSEGAAGGEMMLILSLQPLELHELLGNGGTGNVYRATCHTKKVAARRVGANALRNGKSAEALRSEYLALGQLKHPHLARVLCLAADSSQLVSTVVICELAQMSLQAALQNGQLEAVNWTNGLLKVLYETMSGLSFLHERGVYHGLLHPRNVLLSSKLKVKLVDYARCVCTLPNMEDEAGDRCARWAYVAVERWGAKKDSNVMQMQGRPFKTLGELKKQWASSFGLGDKSFSQSKKSLNQGEKSLSLGDKSYRSRHRLKEIVLKRVPSLGVRVPSLTEMSTRRPQAAAKVPKAPSQAKQACEAMNALAMADMWSFGCLVALTATGEPPYSAEIEARVSSQESSPGEAVKAACKHGISPMHRFCTLAQVVDDGSSAASATGDLDILMLRLASQCVQINPYARPRAPHVRSQIHQIGQAAMARLPNAAGEQGLKRSGAKLAGHHSSSTRLPLPSRLPAPANVAHDHEVQEGTKDEKVTASQLLHLIDLHRHPQSGTRPERQGHRLLKRRQGPAKAAGLSDVVSTVVDGKQAARINHRLRI